MEYVLLPAIQLGIPGNTPLGLALVDSSFLFWKSKQAAIHKLLVIGRKSNIYCLNKFKSNSSTICWVYYGPHFMLNKRTGKKKKEGIFCWYIHYGGLLYLYQLSPEETTSRLLTVNCPGLYPKVLHVEGHSREDGMATREQLQFCFKCITWQCLV